MSRQVGFQQVISGRVFGAASASVGDLGTSDGPETCWFVWSG
jgi:hypothetical protein